MQQFNLKFEIDLCIIYVIILLVIEVGFSSVKWKTCIYILESVEGILTNICKAVRYDGDFLAY